MTEKEKTFRISTNTTFLQVGSAPTLLFALKGISSELRSGDTWPWPPSDFFVERSQPRWLLLLPKFWLRAWNFVALGTIRRLWRWPALEKAAGRWGAPCLRGLTGEPGGCVLEKVCTASGCLNGHSWWNGGTNRRPSRQCRSVLDGIWSLGWRAKSERAPRRAHYAEGAPRGLKVPREAKRKAKSCCQENAEAIVQLEQKGSLCKCWQIGLWPVALAKRRRRRQTLWKENEKLKKWAASFGGSWRKVQQGVLWSYKLSQNLLPRKHLSLAKCKHKTSSGEILQSGFRVLVGWRSAAESKTEIFREQSCLFDKGIAPQPRIF